MTPDLTPDLTPNINPLRPVTIGIPHAVAQKLSEWHNGTLEDATLTALRLYHGIGPAAHIGLMQAAQNLGIGQVKAMRTAIELLLEQTNKIKTIPNPKGRPVTNQERDTAIFLRINEGATQAEVAHAFGVSLVRIGQIVAQQRALRGLSSKRKPRTTNHGQPQPPDIGTLFAALDSGMTRATAATTYNLTVERIERAYAAYKAALPPSPTKGDKVSATFAGIHALEDPTAPEVLSLKHTDTPLPPRRLAVIPPSMRAKMETLPPLPADTTPGQSATDLMNSFQLDDDLL
jgi:Mor family transcriptional regulator